MAQQLMSFSVRRHGPILVAPAEPTPRELRRLSDIDDQQSLRVQIPMFFFYRLHGPSAAAGKNRKDPAGVIRDALARALVFYYPFAGRLREGPEYGKLLVDCTGEGVLFVEADADVRLEQFGNELLPPFPCLDELILDIDSCSDIIDSPLFVFQVTRLLCGGFILGMKFNHTMCDGFGLAQFLKAIAELARGLHPGDSPAIRPVWARELLEARDPPRPTHPHPEFRGDISSAPLLGDVICRAFSFAPGDISALRNRLPLRQRGTFTAFELLTAFIWKTRAAALCLPPEEDATLAPVVDVRKRIGGRLPAGYYGNVLAFPAATTTVEKLDKNLLGYAAELIKKAVEAVNEEYLQSTADLLVLRGRPHVMGSNPFVVSNLTRLGLEKVDFGWGTAVFAGPAAGWPGPAGSLMSFYIAGRNSNGEIMTVVPIHLPAQAMERFAAEVDKLINESVCVEKQLDYCNISAVSTATNAVKSAL